MPITCNINSEHVFNILLNFVYVHTHSFDIFVYASKNEFCVIITQFSSHIHVYIYHVVIMLQLKLDNMKLNYFYVTIKKPKRHEDCLVN